MKIKDRFIFPFLLFLVVSVLFVFNYEPGAFLLGWDNLPVELNLLFNLERSLNVSWQEYQGLGLLGGMGHGADLIRQLILLPFSLFLNQSLLRYLWHFSCLYVGSLGAFYLFSYLIKNKLISFLGSLFYLLNIGTVQNFYVAFEPFSAFFAFLPFLIRFLFSYLKDSKKKDFRFFILFSLLGTTSFYVQTIFIVYLIILLIILLVFYLENNNSKNLHKLINVLLVTFIVNAFWLLPVVLFTLTESNTVLMAKGNNISTEITFLRNNKFGNLFDLLQMRGYWFDFTDFSNKGNQVYILDSWKSHFGKLWGFLTTIIFALLFLLGLFSSLFTKKKSKVFLFRKIILILALFTIFILLGENPPFAFIFTFIKNNIPLFSQVFRSSFTKWIVPFSLFYSFFISWGLFKLLELMRIKLKSLSISFLFLLSLFLYSFPSFQGHYFYKNMRVNMPEAYLELFDYFDKEVDPSSRIANFPQHSFYGWQWNDWGYRGSGFLWYGIKQPILDRAFDVWSEANERYYWQLQYAVDKNDITLFENVLRQYDVDYLILDQSIVNRNTSEPFIYESWTDFFADSELIFLEKEFGFIQVYYFADDENSREKDFISFYSGLNQIKNDYSFSYYDQAFLDLGDYLAVDSPEIVYPFPSLFTNHTQEELELEIQEDDNYFYLYPDSSLLSSFENLEIITRDYLEQEKYFPVKISWSTNEGVTSFELESAIADISWKDKNYSWEIKKSLSLDSSFCQTNGDCYLVVNNKIIDPFAESGSQQVLLFSKQSNVISLARENKVEYYDYAKLDFSFFELKQTIKKLEESSDLQIRVPKIKFGLLGQNLLETDLNQDFSRNCDSFLDGDFSKEIVDGVNIYGSKGAKSCDSFYVSDFDHAQSYLLVIKAANKKSLPLLFAVQSPSQARSPIETFLSESDEFIDNYIILPPTEDFNSAYNLYFSTDSYGREKNENQLAVLKAYYFPSNFIRSLKLTNPALEIKGEQANNCHFDLNKKSLWFYQLNLNRSSCNQETIQLKLSQAYSDDWLAFTNHGFLKHSKVNNWANAWLLDLVDYQDDEIIINIFFWPQLLEYLGLGLLVIIGTYLVLRD